MLVDDSTDIEKISLISTGSTTHAQASELKYLSLNFKKINKNEIEFSIPKNKNTLIKKDSGISFAYTLVYPQP